MTSPWQRLLFAAVLWAGAPGASSAQGTAPTRTLTREPQPGEVRADETVWVDDHSCPAGQIKQIIGGSNYVYREGIRRPGKPRQVMCVPRN